MAFGDCCRTEGMCCDGRVTANVFPMCPAAGAHHRQQSHFIYGRVLRVWTLRVRAANWVVLLRGLRLHAYAISCSLAPVSKHENMEMPFLGHILKILYTISIDRRNNATRNESSSAIVLRAKSGGLWPQVLTLFTHLLLQ